MANTKHLLFHSKDKDPKPDGATEVEKDKPQKPKIKLHLDQSKKKNIEAIFPDRESVKIPTHTTIMATPIYICDDLNSPVKELRSLLTDTPVIVLSDEKDTWVKIETADGPYLHGFVINFFLKKAKEKDK